ncbi:MAG: transglycosylase domain-containing protein, partial [Actinomycetota bacterium]
MSESLPRARRAVLGLAVIALSLGACVKLPDLQETLANAHRLSETSFVLANDGRVITALHEVENREVIPITEVPTHVQHAVVAIEDERFFDHPGVDFRAILRAFVKNTAEGRVVEGGSTITQQYIKNALIDRERNIKGKLDEAVLAWKLEKEFTKEEILGLYLNTVYFGQGAYGIEAAAGTFFGKHARQLAVHEGALLAGLIKSPTRYDPYANPEAALGRRNIVLQRMREQGYLKPEQAVAALKQKLGVKPPGGTVKYPAAYFVEYVKDLIQRDPRFDMFGATIGERVNALFKGGLRIHTTIDLRLQKIAEDASRKVLAFKKDPSNAFVALDPRTGEIKAMVGGRDFFDPKDPHAKFNLAVQSRRQPGSSFKTFTLVGALEEGIPLEQIYRGGSVISIPMSNGQTWVVHNYDSLSFGSRLSLREATIKSVNVVYAQVVQEIGANKVVDVAKRMGVTSKLSPFPSIAIGAQE